MCVSIDSGFPFDDVCVVTGGQVMSGDSGDSGSEEGMVVVGILAVGGR